MPEREPRITEGEKKQTSVVLPLKLLRAVDTRVADMIRRGESTSRTEVIGMVILQLVLSDRATDSTDLRKFRLTEESKIPENGFPT